MLFIKFFKHCLIKFNIVKKKGKKNILPTSSLLNPFISGFLIPVVTCVHFGLLLSSIFFVLRWQRAFLLSFPQIDTERIIEKQIANKNDSQRSTTPPIQYDASADGFNARSCD